CRGYVRKCPSRELRKQSRWLKNLGTNSPWSGWGWSANARSRGRAARPPGSARSRPWKRLSRAPLRSWSRFGPGDRCRPCGSCQLHARSRHHYLLGRHAVLMRQRIDVERHHRGDAHQRGQTELAGEKVAIEHGRYPPGATVSGFSKERANREKVTEKSLQDTLCVARNMVRIAS